VLIKFLILKDYFNFSNPASETITSLGLHYCCRLTITLMNYIYFIKKIQLAVAKCGYALESTLADWLRDCGGEGLERY
jgi:hypothetical protein